MLGRDPHRDREVQRSISLVPEDEAVPPALTARQLVRYTAALHGVDDRDAARPVPRHASACSTWPTARWAASARACASGPRWPSSLVTAPRVLVLDEPLNGADPVQRVALIELFQALGDQGRTVIVSSHVLHEVERLASRQIVVIRGRLAAAGDHRAIRDALADRPRAVSVRTPAGPGAGGPAGRRSTRSGA